MPVLMNKMPLTGDRLLCSEKKKERKSILASRTYYSQKVNKDNFD